jgi:hypothetical protein
MCPPSRTCVVARGATEGVDGETSVPAGSVRGTVSSTVGAGSTNGGSGGTAGVGSGAGSGVGSGVPASGGAGSPTAVATAASGAGVRTGRNTAGSRYPCGSAERLTPRWTYGTLTSGSPLGPIVPTPSPSATVAPLEAVMEPRWVSVTDQPSGVSIVTALPLPGTVPAKLTVPEVGARTSPPTPPPTSMPRC